MPIVYGPRHQWLASRCLSGRKILYAAPKIPIFVSRSRTQNDETRSSDPIQAQILYPYRLMDLYLIYTASFGTSGSLLVN